MKVYKRGIISLIWSLILAVFGGAFVGFIIYLFYQNMYVYIGVPIIITLLMGYGAIFKENIKFELEEEQLRYFEKKNLVHSLDLSEYYVGYRTKTSDGSADYIYLNLQNEDSNESMIEIDCTPLGTSKFYKMYNDLENYAKKPETQKLETQKLETKKTKSKKM